MTSSAVSYLKNLEDARANRAREAENERSNKAKEEETHRANKQNELLKARELSEEVRKNMADYKLKEDQMANENEVAKRRGSGTIMGALMNIGADVHRAIYGKRKSGTDAYGDMSSNDLSWHVKDQAEYENLTRVAFPYKKGQGIVGKTPLNIDDGFDWSTGYYIIHLVPTIGTETNIPENGEVQTATRETFVGTRRYNAGSVNYDSTDEMMVILAISSILTTISKVERMLAVAELKMDSKKNKYVNNLAMLNALTYGNGQAFITDKVGYLSTLNRAIRKLNALGLPCNYDQIKRYIYLQSQIFVKDVENKDIDIWYICDFDGYWIYDEINGKLVYNKYKTTDFASPTSVMNLLVSMISPIFNSTIGTVIAGDIEKAIDYFGKDALVHLDEYKLADPIELEFSEDPHFFITLRNAMVFPNIVDSTLDVSQDISNTIDPYLYQGTKVGNIHYGPAGRFDAYNDLNNSMGSAIDYDALYTSGTQILPEAPNFLAIKEKNPTSESILYATLWQASYRVHTPTGRVCDFDLTASGTEAVTDIECYGYISNNANSVGYYKCSQYMYAPKSAIAIDFGAFKIWFKAKDLPVVWLLTPEIESSSTNTIDLSSTNLDDQNIITAEIGYSSKVYYQGDWLRRMLSLNAYSCLVLHSNLKNK